MARRRRKRTRRHVGSRQRTQNTRQRTREGRLILRDTPDDKAAAHLMGEVYQDKNDVLDATDLNEAFKYYTNRHK